MLTILMTMAMLTCHYAECRFDDCDHTEYCCRYGDYGYSEYCYTECYFDDCAYTDLSLC